MPFPFSHRYHRHFDAAPCLGSRNILRSCVHPTHHLTSYHLYCLAHYTRSFVMFLSRCTLTIRTLMYPLFIRTSKCDDPILDIQDFAHPRSCIYIRRYTFLLVHVVSVSSLRSPSLDRSASSSFYSIAFLRPNADVAYFIHRTIS